MEQFIEAKRVLPLLVSGLFYLRESKIDFLKTVRSNMVGYSHGNNVEEQPKNEYGKLT